MIFIPHSRMNHEVCMFDVGHGDCVLISDDKGQGLLVDCGAWKHRHYLGIPQIIENLLLANNRCGFVVSHYHWDHYNLFRGFKLPNALFSKIYLPNLPIVGPGREATLAIMDFLKVAVYANFLSYRILPEIFTKTRRPVVFCEKGTPIHEASLPLKVFWPDLSHPTLGSRKVKKKACIIREIVEPIMDRYNIPKPSDYYTDYSMEKFFQQLKEIPYFDLQERERRKIHETLKQIERVFSKLADIFSIAFRTHYSRGTKFLFLGDLTNDLLNRITIPGNKQYDCLKAAHHGTRFGSALRNISTDFILISRSQRDFPNIKQINSGYISEIQYHILLCTEFLGDCYIH